MHFLRGATGSVAERAKREVVSQIEELVAAELDSGRFGHDTEALVTSVLRDVQLPSLELQAKRLLEDPWIRHLTVPSDSALYALQGLYSGDSYEIVYRRWELVFGRGATYLQEAISWCYCIPPDFREFTSDSVILRACDEKHRDDLIASVLKHQGEIEQQLEPVRAAAPVYARELVASELDRRTALEASMRSLKEDGWETPGDGRPKPPVPLKHQRTILSSIPPADRSVDDSPAALSDEQFKAVLSEIRTYKDNCERLPGAGPIPTATEEDCRDSLLAALRHAFPDGTGEAFSSKGKTDIRLYVALHSYFYAECKLWGGPARVVEAFDQLTGRYLTLSDRHGALVFFVSGIQNPTQLPGKAIARLEAERSTQRLADIAGFPVLRCAARPDDGPSLDLALVFIHIDQARRNR